MKEQRIQETIEVPNSTRVLNAFPVDYYYGPWSGDDLPSAIAKANSKIPEGVRYPSMTIGLYDGERAYKYWYQKGTTDADLVPYEPQVKDVVYTSYTDDTRPSPGIPGRVIFNTDDKMLNIDIGTDWTLPDGTIT